LSFMKMWLLKRSGLIASLTMSRDKDNLSNGFKKKKESTLLWLFQPSRMFAPTPLKSVAKPKTLKQPWEDLEISSISRPILQWQKWIVIDTYTGSPERKEILEFSC
jgi:hypothetical protein